MKKIKENKEGKITGKAIYSPTGKAGEYSQFGVNFYTGCSNQCKYCYLNKGITKSKIGGDCPKLKRCFKDEEDAIKVYKRELLKYQDPIKDKGVFLSFTTDPFLPETKNLTFRAIEETINLNIPVQILTKRADWLEDLKVKMHENELYNQHKELIAFGFTLTGCDEEETYASKNMDRLKAMRELYNFGYKTFASIEPVIYPVRSMAMIEITKKYCDIFKIGLMSGKKDYNKMELIEFYNYLLKSTDVKIYLKDSFTNFLRIDRNQLPLHFVDLRFNIFT